MLFDIFENIFKNGGRNLLLIGTVGTLGISLYLAGLYYFDDFIVYITAFRTLIPFLGVFIAAIITPLLLNYLNFYKYEIRAENAEKLDFKVYELEERLQEIERTAFNNILVESLANDGDQHKKENLWKLILKYSYESVQRINIEKNSLSRRGNLNLLIGMFLSISGIVVLGISVFNFVSVGDFNDVITKMIPRFLFVVLIEVFAYFFLNLYRKSLEDIKYYQNELTNLEAKYLSLQTSLAINNYKLINSVVEQLVKTERNFILEKDQSTIEIEKERINSNNTNNTLQILKDIFKNKV
jgi:phosphate/sulfate permease